MSIGSSCPSLLCLHPWLGPGTFQHASKHLISYLLPFPAQLYRSSHTHRHMHTGEHKLFLSELLITPGPFPVLYQFLTPLYTLVLSACNSLSCLYFLLNSDPVLQDPGRMTLAQWNLSKALIYYLFIQQICTKYLLHAKKTIWCGR